MNQDDDTLLSAFLDDELDPGDHQAVAWAVESSPEVAGRLADLRAVGAVVRDLARPAVPIDLSAAILARLATATRDAPGIAAAEPPSEIIVLPTSPRRRRLTGAARVAASLVGIGSVAASLLLALMLLHNALHTAPQVAETLVGTTDSPRNHPIIDPPTSEPSAPLAVAPAPAAPAPPAVVAGPRSVEPPALVEADKAKQPDRAEASGVDGPEPARPGQVDAMLGHARVLRALIVADALDPTARQVRAIIEQDPDREAEFGQITLVPGVVVDPDRPGAAEVYSVVMPASDTRAFLDRLRRDFPGLVVEAEAAPILVTQLSQIGQVAVYTGVRPARLGLPPRGLPPLVAVKAANAPDHFRADIAQIHPLPEVAPADERRAMVSQPLVPAEPSPKDLAGPGRLAKPGGAPPAPAPVRAQPEARFIVPTPVGTEPVTVLVWVTRGARP